MLVWAAHNGGYDADTWYWGGLVALSLLAAVIVMTRPVAVSRPVVLAIAGFGLYVVWSYVSIAWAQSPGSALTGSNRALLYFLVFSVCALVPWTPRAGLLALALFALGVGLIGLVLVLRMASADHLGSLLAGRHLAAPTGYYNATAALFTMGALVGTVLASRRELPGLVRGLAIAFACTDLQLALMAQSRGWLFTLPLIGVVALLVCPDRLRVAGTAVIPIVGTLVAVHRFLGVFSSQSGSSLDHAASRAGQAALIIWTAALVLGTVIAWTERLVRTPSLGRVSRRMIGTIGSALALAGAVVALLTLTHGNPGRFISRQWRGLSHPEAVYSTHSHFGDIGSGRYDFWRVGLAAFAAHPLDGLGQDNFANYYVLHRRTGQEPQWPHSVEIRLLAQTGLVGFILFFAFLLAALWAAIRVRRRGSPLARAAAATALLPVIVWLIHGSLDWFWEMPALSGPAVGFLGLACALSAPHQVRGEPAAHPTPRARRSKPRRPVAVGAAALATIALVAGAAVLGVSYLSVREVSMASDVSATDPSAALADLSRAAELNPLSADPGLLGGEVAMAHNQPVQARARFGQASSRDPGDWFAWLGSGLARSALGDRTAAKRDFQTAVSINARQPPVRQALARVDSRHPLTYTEAIRLMVVAP